MAESKEELMARGYTLTEEAIPSPGTLVILVTPQVQCIGFLDPSFNWRYAKDHGLIRNVIAWADLDSFMVPH
jgi:hypothetical protein